MAEGATTGRAGDGRTAIGRGAGEVKASRPAARDLEGVGAEVADDLGEPAWRAITELLAGLAHVADLEDEDSQHDQLPRTHAPHLNSPVPHTFRSGWRRGSAGGATQQHASS